MTTTAVHRIPMSEIAASHASKYAHAGNCTEPHDRGHDQARRTGPVGRTERSCVKLLVKVHTNGHVEATQTHDETHEACNVDDLIETDKQLRHLLHFFACYPAGLQCNK